MSRTVKGQVVFFEANPKNNTVFILKEDGNITAGILYHDTDDISDTKSGDVLKGIQNGSKYTFRIEDESNRILDIT